MAKAERFKLTAGVRKDGTPAVILEWGKMKAAMSPREARANAEAFALAAGEAEADAALLAFLGQSPDADQGRNLKIVRTVKNWREKVRLDRVAAPAPAAPTPEDEPAPN